MTINHFQKEETYLFSSLLDHLRGLSQKDVSVTTKSLLTIFWKIYGEIESLEPLLEDLAEEIGAYSADPTRESNRTKKVFACAVYRKIAKKPKHEEILENYFRYAMDSKDWLGQPRIACCVALLKEEPVGKEAKNYLKNNFSPWLSDGRDDFISVALIALGSEVSRGDLQKTIEQFESRINDLSLNTSSLYLIGISRSQNLPTKNEIEDRLYQNIKEQITKVPIATLDTEGIISAATAIFIAKYHIISGYYEKYASELKKTLVLKDDFFSSTKKAKVRGLLLCITLIVAIGLLCLMFYLPTIVVFEKNPSTFGKILLTINSKKGWALGTSSVLVAYILISYFKSGDPVLGLIDWMKGKLPELFKEEKKG